MRRSLDRRGLARDIDGLVRAAAHASAAAEQPAAAAIGGGRPRQPARSRRFDDRRIAGRRRQGPGVVVSLEDGPRRRSGRRPYWVDDVASAPQAGGDRGLTVFIVQPRRRAAPAADRGQDRSRAMRRSPA